ncbi:7tm Odorant receptor [Popillia japonica]|uniref:Odorant receptor n=1 Tax=Popillia japonica TaxID=7064 RepID=A0AAW1IXI7_POPJA
MEDLPRTNIIDTVVDLYQLIGETKRKTSRKLLGFRVFNFCAFVLTLFFIVANFYYIEGELYVPTLLSFLLIAHVFLKYMLFLYYKSNIGILLGDVAYRSWNYSNFNAKTVLTIEHIHKTIKYLQRIMLTVVIFGIYAYLLKPSLAANKGLILEAVVPRAYFVDVIMLMAQYYCVGIALPMVIGYDFIYFSLCIHVVLQLRLFKERMDEILRTPTEDNKLKLNYCIYHHQFLLSIFFRMRAMYSIMLLFHYFVSLISSCSMLYEIMMRDTNFMNYIAKSISIVIIVGQFALYAFPAEQVAFEFSDVADAIYRSCWYKENVLNQKMLSYIMVAAQRVRYFSGAGLVDINVDAFESVLRKSFSFCMVLRNLINK